MPTVFSLWVAVCCTLELTQPSQAQGPATFLGMADERLLVLRMGIWPNWLVGPTYYEKIRPGMTEGDVNKVLGCPTFSKDFSKYSVTKMVPAPTPQGFRGFRVMKTNTWVGINQVIEIDFGEKGTVESGQFDISRWVRSLTDVSGVKARSTAPSLSNLKDQTALTVEWHKLVSLEQWAYMEHFDTRNDFKKLRAWLQQEP